MKAARLHAYNEKLKLDEVVSHRIGLGDTEEAFHAMHDGKTLRSVIEF